MRDQPPTTTRKQPTGASRLAAAHARFARAALLIYAGAAAVAVTLLFAVLLTNKTHDEEQSRGRLMLETDVRAHSLGQHMGLLVGEMRRLSLRSEVDLNDEDLTPEKSLLQLSHGKSTFFNLGVAILDRAGSVIWSEPQHFLQGASFASEKWFTTLRTSRALRIVPVEPNQREAVLYVVSPLIRTEEFAGALLGAVDLDEGEPIAETIISAGIPLPESIPILATHEGAIIYPPTTPPFASELGWTALFKRPTRDPFTETSTLSGTTYVITSSPVTGTDLVLMSLVPKEELYRPTVTRFRTRLTVGLVLAIAPLLLLVLLLRRSLIELRASEEDAVREERLRMLGEAANAIAHEIKNALNGLSMGLEMVARRDERPLAVERRARVLGELRKEIQRLSDFTSELMTFSKGIAPRRTRLDLVNLVDKVTGLYRDTAEEIGARLDLEMPKGEAVVDADPMLLHLVISNLVGNALEAATGQGGRGEARVEVRLEPRDDKAALWVRDSGPGVSPSMMPRLFEPFQTDKPNGVGLGLALSRKIAQAHGGDLVLEESGQEASHGLGGASFLLVLPLGEARKAEGLAQ